MRDVALPRLVLAFALVFGVALTWAAATPMFGVPDEVSHMVRAAAAARGDLAGRPVADGGRTYRAPAVLQPASRPEPTGPGGTLTPEDLQRPCFAFRASQGAECLRFSGDGGDVQLASTAEGYPPAYYLLVGWPSRLVPGLPGLYAMRAASAAWFAALVALALVSIGSGPRWAPARLGVALALTPMVWFMGASVNPASMAIGAGVASWCGGLRLVTAGPDERLAPLAWRFGLPMCLLLLVRRDSLLWGGLVVLALAATASAGQASRLVRSRPVLGWATAAAACATYSATVTVGTTAGFLGAEASTGSASGAFGSMPYYLDQMVGVLGWLDTRLPELAYLLSWVTIGGLVLAAVAFARRRQALVVAAMVTALVGAIVVVGANRFPYFQGRYALPFAVGIPIVAGFALVGGEHRIRAPRRPVALVLGSAAVVHLLAYHQQIRRYSVSGRTTWWVFDHPTWHPPPAPTALLLVLHVALVGAAAYGWYRSTVDEAPSTTPARRG